MCNLYSKVAKQESYRMMGLQQTKYIMQLMIYLRCK